MKRLIAITCLLFVATSVAATDVPAELQPAWLIELPSTVDNVLIADAGNATLHRYMNQNGKLSLAGDQYMSIGLNGIRKVRAWDKKTPLGAYFVTERLDTSRMHDKYGIAAFPLDYPNAWDRYNSRTGYGIWLHGVDKKQPRRPAMDTDGCLALPNEALARIASSLTPLVTPVIVAAEMQWANRAEIEAIRLAFHSAIDRWQKSQIDGDLQTYLSSYSDEFRHHGMNKADWSAFRLQVFEARSIVRHEIRDLLLLAEPGDENLYLSRFTQLIETQSATTTTTKRLYWRRVASGRWRIVAEGAG